MAATVVTSPFSSILDLTGAGLSQGSVYIGVANQNPQTNPQAVYWDAALTIPATQPLQVSGGYIMRLGAPAVAYTSGDYSITALDHLGVQVFTRSTSTSVAPTLPAVRTLLAANADFYVSTLGSDLTGTGSAGAPWATIQKALNVLLASYDLGGFTATIHVASGTYAGATVAAAPPGATGGSVVISGAGVGATIVQGSGAGAAFTVSNAATLTIINMTIGGAGTYGLQASMGGAISFGSVAFAAVSAAHVFASFSGTILVLGSYSITGGSGAHFQAYATGFIGHFGSPFVCTLTGTPAFSTAFALASDNGVLVAQSSWLTFSGSATGPRYLAGGNGTIDTFGSGASYFPGNSAGSTSNNGIYV